MAVRILIVEDDPNLIVPLQYLLERHDYEVMAVYEGPQALEAVSTFRPHVVLLDILLPGMDGFETCQRIRQLPTGADLRIIFISALSSAVDRAKGLSCGADAYIQKPFSNKDLLAALDPVRAP